VWVFPPYGITEEDSKVDIDEYVSQLGVLEFLRVFLPKAPVDIVACSLRDSITTYNLSY
jgi:hypothetical protein